MNFNKEKTYKVKSSGSFPCPWEDFFFEEENMPSITIHGSHSEERGEWDNDHPESSFYDIWIKEDMLTKELCESLILKYLGITVQIEEMEIYQSK